MRDRHERGSAITEDGGPVSGSDLETLSQTVVSSTLCAAGERVLSGWQSTAGEALNAGEVQDELAALLDELTYGAAAGAAPVDLGTGLLRRRILELLREEVIRQWSLNPADLAPREMLEVLQSFEEVRNRIEPNWDQYFASRLMGPEGLELVVEVAHDLRSPLTSILFLAETLRGGQSGEINDVQRRQLGIVYSAALGLISVASDMIELARGGNQLMEKEPSPFSVTGMLESVHDIVQPMAEEKGLKVRLLLPDQDQRLGYPVALSRILLNLTSNALKFTDEGFIEITARASASSHVEFSVRDTGRGLNQEAVETLFQPFRRTKARKGGHAFSGSGLGLMITRRLVEALGSELQLETRADWGTRFFFELKLPAADPH